MVIDEAALDDGVGDAPGRIVAPYKSLPRHKSVEESEDPVIAVACRVREETGCDPLMHGMEITQCIPDFVGARWDPKIPL